MRLPLAYYGNPVLRQKGARVNEINTDLINLIEDMIETVKAENGIGLAAPQINRSLALFITYIPIPKENDEWDEGPIKVYINPKIIDRSEDLCIRSEACLSLPKLSGDVVRPVEVTVEFTNLEGERVTETYTGLEARCIMHENDHINGTLYIDRMHPKDRKELEPFLREIKKKYR